MTHKLKAIVWDLEGPEAPSSLRSLSNDFSGMGPRVWALLAGGYLEQPAAGGTRGQAQAATKRMAQQSVQKTRIKVSKGTE